MPANDEAEPKMKNENRTDFPPRKRSIPTGFDFDLDEVWWSRQKTKSNSNKTDDTNLNKIVPPQFYSRHLFLTDNVRPQAPVPVSNFGLKTEYPSVTGKKRKSEVPSRAHNGTSLWNANAKEKKTTPSLDSAVFDF